MWMWSPTCRSKARLDGKTAIVTGCNTGIGKATVEDLYERGCRVIMACRNVESAEEARNNIQQQLKHSGGVGSIVVNKCDVSSLQSVRQFAEHILRDEERVDILINNAGIFMCPHSKSVDGFELQLATNHFGHFLLTLLLLPLLLKSAPARIINVTSVVHAGDFDFDDLNYDSKPYSPYEAYGRSKRANILFTKELARRLEGKDVHVYAVHPGAVRTDATRYLSSTYFRGLSWFLHNISGFFLRTPLQGAQTTIHCAVDEDAGRETGLYYADCRVAEPAGPARDMDMARKIWDMSLVLVQVEDPLPQKDKRERSTVKIGDVLYEF